MSSLNKDIYELTFTLMDNLEFPGHLTCMFFELWEEPGEHRENTHTDTW